MRRLLTWFVRWEWKDISLYAVPVHLWHFSSHRSTANSFGIKISLISTNIYSAVKHLPLDLLLPMQRKIYLQIAEACEAFLNAIFTPYECDFLPIAALSRRNDRFSIHLAQVIGLTYKYKFFHLNLRVIWSRSEFLLNNTVTLLEYIKWKYYTVQLMFDGFHRLKLNQKCMK